MVSSLCLCVVVLSLSVLSVTPSGGILQMSCDNTSAEAGSSAMLNCSISLDKTCTFLNFQWNEMKDYLPCGRNNISTNQTRFTCIEQEKNSTFLKFSLLIKNTQKQDQKQYHCFVQTTCGIRNKFASLSITSEGLQQEKIFEESTQGSKSAILKVSLPFLIVVAAIIVFVAINRKRLKGWFSHFAHLISRSGHTDEPMAYTAGNQVPEAV